MRCGDAFTVMTVVILIASWTSGQITIDLNDSDQCHGAADCSECLQTNPLCAWCESKDYSDGGEPRCDSENNLIQKNCEQFTKPETTLNILKNEALRDGGVNSEAVQVQPQEISIKIRAGDTARLNVSVRQAEDYPVDLYYVMDLSRSMLDDLHNLQKLGGTLAKDMASITKNFRLGFGVFVDKTVLPYISTVPRKINEPCSQCEAPYSFRNVLPLDDNTDLFAEKVNATKISGNLDTPEGSLDALMQATVCTSEIGWREKARHLIVYTSDASFHIAGDGRLGGIVTPSDGKCHLDPQTQEYSTADLYDYPSVGQLNAKMRENNIIPIFAVVNDKYTLYENLTDMIEGATVGRLAGDSRNIVEIIKDNYALITQKVELVDSAPADLELSYTSYCLDGMPRTNSKTCTGLGLGDVVHFDIAITARRCLEGRNISFTIQPIGFEETTKINVEVICSCECEANVTKNHDLCSYGNGSLVCGECVCNEGRYGKVCECSGDTAEGTEGVTEETCRPSNNSVVCFGRGECVCGECMCQKRLNPDEVISGKYCECDNFSCARYKGELCGGPEHGQCVCDKLTRKSGCNCKQGFRGEACGCSTRIDTCRTQNGLICNAVGKCECGECICDPKSLFHGKTCDECATCKGDQCTLHQDCVQCKIYKSGRLLQQQCDMCSLDIRQVEKIPYLKDAKNCSFKEETDNCSVNFAYINFSNGTIIVYVQNEKVCPRSGVSPILKGRNLLILISSIVLSIVLIGIVLALIYRMWTYIQDRKEFAQWIKDQQEAKWDKEQNPIYKPTTSTFKNPMYKK